MQGWSGAAAQMFVSVKRTRGQQHLDAVVFESTIVKELIEVQLILVDLEVGDKVECGMWNESFILNSLYRTKPLTNGVRHCGARCFLLTHAAGSRTRHTPIRTTGAEPHEEPPLHCAESVEDGDADLQLSLGCHSPSFLAQPHDGQLMMSIVALAMESARVQLKCLSWSCPVSIKVPSWGCCLTAKGCKVRHGRPWYRHALRQLQPCPRQSNVGLGKGIS
jgi:hypothetical protein